MLSTVAASEIHLKSTSQVMTVHYLMFRNELYRLRQKILVGENEFLAQFYELLYLPLN